MRGTAASFIAVVSLVSHVHGGNETCRLSKDGDIPRSIFPVASCAACYSYSLAKKHSLDASFFENVSYPAMMDNVVILDSLQTVKAQQDWKTCCRQAVECCENMVSSNIPETNGWCPRTWDGWLCWGDGSPGSTHHQPCPPFISSCSKGSAVKTCTENGTWYLHPNSSREWTNYSLCSEAVRQTRSTFLSIGAYATSLLTLVPALYIFYSFSILQCCRVVLHRNLFLSLLLHCSAKITFDCAFLLPEVQGTETVVLNGVWCRLLSAGIVYLTVSNYMWMLCEGLLLYRQLVNAFAPESSKWIFFCIGWGIPAVPLVATVAFRLTSDDTNCWALPSAIDWVWLAPCLLSLLINCVFFTYILTVVVRLSRQISDNVIQFRKAARTGLVLVPLFGLHFTITIYRPSQACTLAEEYYSYVLRLVEGLQGCIVAVTYCYVNSEVRAALWRTWRTLIVRQQLAQGQVNYMSAISSQTVL